MNEKGIKGVIVNPIEEVIEAPIDFEKNAKITGFRFEKNKWNPEDAVKWAKGKINLTDKHKLEKSNQFIDVLMSGNSSSDKVVAVNKDRGIYAFLKLTKIEDNVDELWENPLKITREVLNLIFKHKEKSPKEINTLLKDKFNITLHPATIWKIKIGKYPISKDAGVDCMADRKKEVRMKTVSNPLIAELLANPTVPIVRTQWFKDLATTMYRRGATADEIAKIANETLERVSPEYVKLARIKVGKGWTRPRRIIPLTPGKVLRAMAGVYNKKTGTWVTRPILDISPEEMPGVKDKLISSKMLRGLAAKVYAETGSKEKALKALRAKLEEGRKARKHKSFESPEAQKLLREFLPTGYKARQVPTLTAEQKFERAKKLLQKRLDAGVKLSPKTIKKYGLRRAKKRVDELVNAVAREIATPTDFTDYLDEYDISMLPISDFDDIEQMVDALNPLIRMPNILGALNKFFQQSIGVIPGAWILNIADRIIGAVTGFIPNPLLKGIIHESVADIGVYALAEALIPYRYEIIKQGIQNVAVMKFWNNIAIGKFKLVPDIFNTRRIQFGVAEQVSEYDALSSPVEQPAIEQPAEEEIIGYAEIDDIGQDAEEIYLTEEEVAQLASTSQTDLAFGGFSPTTTPHEQPEVVSDEDVETAFLM